MSTHVTETTLAETVKPLAVHAYLAANGWTRIGPCHGDTGDVYRLHEDEHEAVLVPASTTFADYVTRIVQLAEVLGRVENRRQTAVLADLSLADVDLIRIRLPKTCDDSSIPLAAGVDLLQESRKLLLAAACSASRPQRMFRAGRHQQAAAYVGQGTAGSDRARQLRRQHAGPHLAITDEVGTGATATAGSVRTAGHPDARLRPARRTRSDGTRQSREKISARSRSGSARVSVRTCAKPPPI